MPSIVSFPTSKLSTVVGIGRTISTVANTAANTAVQREEADLIVPRMARHRP